MIWQQLNRAPNHIGKARLLASFLDLIRECELLFGEKCNQFGPTPRRNRFQFCSDVNNVKTIVLHFDEEIPTVRTVATLSFRHELRATAAQSDVDLPARN